VKDDRREAFQKLCREEYAGIVRTAYLITGDREDALDLAQEAFARAYERWRTVSRMDRPGAWVQRVVANLAVSWRRHQRVRGRARRALESVPIVSAPEAPDTGLLEALAAISPAQRTAIVLRFYADLSVEEVAQVLDKRPGTIRALTAQGMARLRSLLANREVEDEVRG
jgi:RNA polymerase sigma-70 factor (sigma-E family)